MLSVRGDSPKGELARAQALMGSKFNVIIDIVDNAYRRIDLRTCHQQKSGRQPHRADKGEACQCAAPRINVMAALVTLKPAAT